MKKIYLYVYQISCEALGEPFFKGKQKSQKIIDVLILLRQKYFFKNNIGII
jgi:hypothetical protein